MDISGPDQQVLRDVAGTAKWRRRKEDKQYNNREDITGGTVLLLIAAAALSACAIAMVDQQIHYGIGSLRNSMPGVCLAETGAVGDIDGA